MASVRVLARLTVVPGRLAWCLRPSIRQLREGPSSPVAPAASLHVFVLGAERRGKIVCRISALTR